MSTTAVRLHTTHVEWTVHPATELSTRSNATTGSSDVSGKSARLHERAVTASVVAPHPPFFSKRRRETAPQRTDSAACETIVLASDGPLRAGELRCGDGARPVPFAPRTIIGARSGFPYENPSRPMRRRSGPLHNSLNQRTFETEPRRTFFARVSRVTSHIAQLQRRVCRRRLP